MFSVHLATQKRRRKTLPRDALRAAVPNYEYVSCEHGMCFLFSEGNLFLSELVTG